MSDKGPIKLGEPEAAMLKEILDIRFPARDGKDHLVDMSAYPQKISLRPAAPLFGVRQYLLENGFEARLTELGTIELLETDGMLFPSTLVNMHRVVTESAAAPDAPGKDHPRINKGGQDDDIGR